MTAEENDRDGKADTEASQQGRSAGDHNTGPNSDSECKVQDHAPFSSPRPGTSAASRPSPLLRANPYSEVMDPICRLPLLTLIYRLKALYLRDLLRIWVRRDTSTWLSPGFLRSEGKIRTPPQLRCFSRSKSYLPARGFQAIRTLIQKRKFFLDHFGLSMNTLTRARMVYGSAVGFRNRNRIPFRPMGVFLVSYFNFYMFVCMILGHLIYIGFFSGLRINWLVCNGCLHESLQRHLFESNCFGRWVVTP